MAAAGLPLHARLNAMPQSLERVEQRGPDPRSAGACRPSCSVAWTRPRGWGPMGGWPLAGCSVSHLSSTTRANSRRPPGSGGGKGCGERWDSSKPQPGPARPRVGTFGRSVAATGQACCTALASLSSPVRIMSWRSFVAPIAVMSGVPPGARSLPPLWCCAVPSDSSPVRRPAYVRS